MLDAGNSRYLIKWGKGIKRRGLESEVSGVWCRRFKNLTKNQAVLTWNKKVVNLEKMK